MLSQEEDTRIADICREYGGGRLGAENKMRFSVNAFFVYVVFLNKLRVYNFAFDYFLFVILLPTNMSHKDLQSDL